MSPSIASNPYDACDLAESANVSLGEALDHKVGTGIAKRSFGPGSARPIVRGFDGDRLYRNHSSFIKDLAPELGRGVRVTYMVRFF